MGAIFGFLPVILPVIVSVVKSVEGLFGKGKGAEKKTIVTGIILALLPLIEGGLHKDLVDNEQFATGVGLVVDGVVMVLKSVNQLPPSA